MGGVGVDKCSYLLAAEISAKAASIGSLPGRQTPSPAAIQLCRGKFFCHAYQDYIWKGVALLHICLQLIVYKVGSCEVISQGCVPGIEQVSQVGAHMVGGVVAAQICHSSYLQKDENLMRSFGLMAALDYGPVRVGLSRGAA